MPIALPDVRPDWREMPSADLLADVYPQKALEKGLGGKATIECKVTVDGDLSDCKVLSESPAGYGFGDAVLKAAPSFKMEPAVRDGARRESTVRIPIVFKPPPAGAASAFTTPEPPAPLTMATAEPIIAVMLAFAAVAALVLAGLYLLVGRRRR